MGFTESMNKHGKPLIDGAGWVFAPLRIKTMNTYYLNKTKRVILIPAKGQSHSPRGTI